MPPNKKDIDTNKIEKKQEAFWNAQMIKLLGICYAVGTPWFVWATVTIFSLQSEVSLVKQRQDTIEMMQRDIREIKDSLVDLKIKVGKIEQKVEIK